MDIKSASKIVQDEIKKIKLEVNNWSLAREAIFKNAKNGSSKETEKTIDSLVKLNDSKDVLVVLKLYSDLHKKMLNECVKKLININLDYTKNLKGATQNLGSLVKPYLETVTGVDFGTDKVAQEQIKKQLERLTYPEMSEVDRSIVLQSLEKQLSLKIKKLINKGIEEKVHLENLANIEVLVTKMLEAVSNPVVLSSSQEEWLEKESFASEIYYKSEFIKRVKSLQDVLVNFETKNSKEIKALLKSYGVTSDAHALKHSKYAMVGVKSELLSFKSYLATNILSDVYDPLDAKTEYDLIQIKNNIDLAKSCLSNNYIAMEKIANSESIDMVDDKLFGYLYSEEFTKKVKEQKREKNKSKINK